MACLIFTAPEPYFGDYFCAPPATVPVENQAEFVHTTHPLKISDTGLSHTVDVCHVFEDAADRWNLTLENPEGVFYSHAPLVPCTDFVHTGEIRSIITDFDLVCSRTILVAVTQTFHLMGVLIGGIIANQMLYR